MDLDFATPAEVWEEIKNSTRVHVLDSSGQKKWKTPQEIAPEDKVLLKSTGDPITMQGQVGRPSKGDDDEEERKVAVKGASEEAIGQLIADKMERRRKTIARDKLRRVTDRDPDSNEVMDLVLKELASEQARMKFELEELEREGKEISEASARRVRILAQLSDSWLKRQERLRDVGVVDLNTPPMREFVRCLGETMNSVMEILNVKADARGAIINKWASSLDDEWKLATQKRMKKKAE